MENKQPLLSLCIPTNGKVEWMIPVIESIYAQRVDNSLFEVIVTDNGEELDLAEAVKKYNYENFHYFQTTSHGFTNQIDAFEKCNGVFCKMLNHRSKMMPGSIEKILKIVRKYQEKKPILYFAEGHAKGCEFIECANTDEFVGSLSYWTSWSCGTGAWKDDLKDIRNKIADKMFPHTVFLFDLRADSDYVIWNEKYEVMTDDTGKGGYDLFDTFGVGFLDIINGLRLRKLISYDTFIKVKRDLYVFLSSLYVSEVLLPTKHTFIIGNVRQSMSVYYGDFYYKKMVLLGRFKAIYRSIRRVIVRK